MNINCVRDMISALKTVEAFAREINVLSIEIYDGRISVMFGTEDYGIVEALPGAMRFCNRLSEEYPYEASKIIDDVKFYCILEKLPAVAVA